jgi:hypothetical protein
MSNSEKQNSVDEVAAKLRRAPVWNVRDLLSRFDIGRTKLYEEMSNGALPSFTLGRTRLVKRQDADQWWETYQNRLIGNRELRSPPFRKTVCLTLHSQTEFEKWNRLGGSEWARKCLEAAE